MTSCSSEERTEERTPEQGGAQMRQACKITKSAPPRRGLERTPEQGGAHFLRQACKITKSAPPRRGHQNRGGHRCVRRARNNQEKARQSTTPVRGVRCARPAADGTTRPQSPREWRPAQQNGPNRLKRRAVHCVPFSTRAARELCTA
eukprot:6636122-Pyramimonas_sp.AAC.1